jgi:hypothetical protein
VRRLHGFQGVACLEDEAMFAACVYKITHTLGSNVDLATITNGSGGFRYSQSRILPERQLSALGQMRSQGF